MPARVEVNWRASKEPLARFVRLLYDRDSSGSQRESFYKEIPPGGIPLDGLLYDLGHSGRGFDEFPYIVTLDASQSREITLPYAEDKGLEVDMKVADLIKQLKSQIEDFVMQHPYAQSNPEPYVTTMKTLDVLAKRADDQKVKIIFGTDFQHNRVIESLTLHH